ncbi:NAD(P)-dependent oxidoreductase [Rubellimicrobium rubrum]|uniref:NAD(P)-dependent oxidoreductase n=1 Tax=Rubellimicrobium rubrum TaxID=2585369 RepID=A0A5C4N492_9RHOB|nr:NAD(P)-dependent oxidoreductase [Rubellimicrobium rubrum]TNC51657.1 NAD(P)-dependent oxidoreductase [Rubellimicrobium rubrum]
MRVAITGGWGRVGRAIVPAALAQGWEVVVIDREPAPQDAPEVAQAMVLEMADRDGLLAAFRGCDALIHMAAIPSPRGRHPHDVHNLNVTGSYNALDAATAAGIRRIVQGSSVNAIGLAYSVHHRFECFPIDETHPFRGDDPYALSKWICELQGQALAQRVPGLQVASLRMHWVVPDRATAVRRFTLEAADGRRELWAYTLDTEAARACVLALETEFGGHEVFQVVAPDTTLEVPTAEAVARFYPEVPLSRPLEGCESLFDSSKAGRLLGWHHPAGAAS